jgi:protein subunit release factor A
MGKKKELLFRLTKKDFKIQTFRSGGKGGQHQNTTNSGCRIIHKESGAVGEARDRRSFHKNKKIAFERLVKSKEFKKWHKIKVGYALQGIQDFEKKIEEEVDEWMKPKYLKIETYKPIGKGGE